MLLDGMRLSLSVELPEHDETGLIFKLVMLCRYRGGGWGQEAHMDGRRRKLHLAQRVRVRESDLRARSQYITEVCDPLDVAISLPAFPLRVVVTAVQSKDATQLSSW